MGRVLRIPNVLATFKDMFAAWRHTKRARSFQGQDTDNGMLRKMSCPNASSPLSNSTGFESQMSEQLQINQTNANQQRSMRRVFTLLDHDGSGRISQQELT